MHKNGKLTEFMSGNKLLTIIQKGKVSVISTRYNDDINYKNPIK